jgi:DNA-binding transcriptional ArsR family regulator
LSPRVVMQVAGRGRRVALDNSRRLANYLSMSSVFKALADPTRRQVLQLLRQGPKSAGELAEHFPVSKPTMSAHFAVLREAGLVDSDKKGKNVVYRLKMSVLEEALMEFSALLGLDLAQRAGRTSGRANLGKEPTK